MNDVPIYCHVSFASEIYFQGRDIEKEGGHEGCEAAGEYAADSGSLLSQYGIVRR